MEKIVTQDVYLQTNRKDADYTVRVWNGEHWAFIENIEKHFNMVVLTKEQYEKNIRDAVGNGYMLSSLVAKHKVDYQEYLSKHLTQLFGEGK